MELEVKGCSDCPMCFPDDISVSYSCLLNKDGLFDVDKNYLPITPSWCPLKIEPIIITLKNEA